MTTATKKKAKPASPAQKQLDEEWKPKPPKAVQDAADEYVSKLQAKNKALKAMNSAWDKANDAMKKHDIEFVDVLDGKKRLHRTNEDKLKLEKIKESNGQVELVP